MAQPARWFLQESHYLTVPGTEWEYVEQPRNGRPIRHRFQVPLFLNPKDANDYNYPEDERIVVANAPNPLYPRDIVFLGDPTPAMSPLNPEAEAISAGFAGKWRHPIESLSSTYSQSLLTSLEERLAEMLKISPAPVVSAPTSGVGTDMLSKLQLQLDAAMVRIAELEERREPPPDDPVLSDEAFAAQAAAPAAHRRL